MKKEILSGVRNFCLTLFALIAALISQAQIIHVPGDYPTIRQAIGAAAPGDTVLVDDGIYYEQISFLGKKPLVVASNFIMDGDDSHIANTIIDGSQITDPDSASVVYFVSGEDTTSVLCGFTIRNGRGSNVIGNYSPDLEGGGIWVSGSGATIRNNHITKNKCDDLGLVFDGVKGGGISVHFEEEDYWVVITDNLIDSNKVTCNYPGALAAGGGLHIGNNCRLANNTIRDNIAEALSATYNAAEGGGIHVEAESEWNNQALISGNQIEHNIARGYYVNGGGMFFYNVEAVVEGNSVIFNRSERGAGTDYVGSGGILVAECLDGTVIRGNLIQGNYSESWAGGVSLATNNANPAFVITVENNYFIGNHSGDAAGALGTWNYPVLLQNNVFQGNEALLAGAAAFHNQESHADQNAWLINNSFAGNTAEECGSVEIWNGNAVILNCIFWQNSAAVGNELRMSDNSFVEFAYTDIDTTVLYGTGGWMIGPGVYHEDPLFDDPGTLLPANWSPCVDAGTDAYVCYNGAPVAAPTYEIRGLPRPAGLGFDMGAYDLEAWGMGIRSIERGPLQITNYPNPFSAFTVFQYSLPETAQVTLQIFDSDGKMVAEPVTGSQAKGGQQVQWNTADLPSGMYYYLIRAGNKTGTGKLVKY